MVLRVRFSVIPHAASEVDGYNGFGELNHDRHASAT